MAAFLFFHGVFLRAFLFPAKISLVIKRPYNLGVRWSFLAKSAIWINNFFMGYDLCDAIWTKSACDSWRIDDSLAYWCFDRKFMLMDFILKHVCMQIARFCRLIRSDWLFMQIYIWKNIKDVFPFTTYEKNICSTMTNLLKNSWTSVVWN